MQLLSVSIRDKGFLGILELTDITSALIILVQDMVADKFGGSIRHWECLTSATTVAYIIVSVSTKSHIIKDYLYNAEQKIRIRSATRSTF